MRLLISFLSSCFLFVLTCTAQTTKTFNGPYTLPDSTSGVALYNYRISEHNIEIFEGKFAFRSNVATRQNTNVIQQLNMAGSFANHAKNGAWTYENNLYEVKVQDIKDLKVNALLYGVQHRLLASYLNGLPIGKWQYFVQNIKESKRMDNSASAIVNFINGHAEGEFEYTENEPSKKVMIKGRFSSGGFFDGLWRIKYNEAGKTLEEERTYQDGLLLLIRLKSNNDAAWKEHKYDDVALKLELINDNPQNINFVKGEAAFGVAFNDGFRDDDERLLLQAEGNAILQSAFMLLTDTGSRGFISSVGQFIKPNFGFTRRFKYVYPEEELKAIAQLSKDMAKLDVQIDTLLSEPTFKVYRYKDDDLSYFYAWLIWAENKLEILNKYIEKLNGRQFDYEYRDNFFTTGIPELNTTDTIEYATGKGKVIKIHTPPLKINSPENLVANIRAYFDSIQNTYNIKRKWLENSLLTFKKEEKLSEIDKQIAVLIDSVNMLYTGMKVLKNVKTLTESEMRNVEFLEAAVFQRFGINLKNQKIQRYANETEIDKRLEAGRSIINLLNAIIKVKPQLNTIKAMPAKLDKVYTEFRPNPFFDRDVESRIRNGIYTRGTEILLPYLIREMLASENSATLLLNAEQIFKLEAIMLSLARSEDPDVVRLNRRLRRENQPERIKRLLFSRQIDE